jgi:phosphomannomutase/phosphoglucomutase
MSTPDPSPTNIPAPEAAIIAASGFREYDARWRYPEDINPAGMTALGLGIGTQMYEAEIAPIITVGHDYRAYSPEVKAALIVGLVRAGIHVKDIGMALSPMAYFSQFHLDIPAVAMVTASHNPNGWTGVKMGFERPLTHGPDDMARLRDIVLGRAGIERSGGRVEQVAGLREAYIDDLCGDFRMTRRLRVVCATGNGTASAFAPEILERIGIEVIPLHCNLDHSFPHYNPNPEALEMLHDMAAKLRATGADLALGFDGDGDRCGVVADDGAEIFADKVGVILARDYSRRFPDARFVVDVKSTGLYASDPVLGRSGAVTDYWKTGHSHMKRRVRELGALAGFEKSGHYFLAEPIGRGYDCGMRVAVELCKLLDRHPHSSMSDLHEALPRTYSTPTMSPDCADHLKYEVVKRIAEAIQTRQNRGERFAGHEIVDINTINGARIALDNGSWTLVRASSNTPNLVVVCESTQSRQDLKDIFRATESLIRQEPDVGAFDQTI